VRLRSSRARAVDSRCKTLLAHFPSPTSPIDRTGT